MNEPFGQTLFSSELPQSVIAEISDLLKGILASLPVNLAILDENGLIIAVNLAWCEFADANGLNDPVYGIGKSYLAVCTAEAGIDADLARDASEGLHQILSGERSTFRLEYPGHRPNQQRWYRLCASSFQAKGKRYGVVLHEDITQRVVAEAQAQVLSQLPAENPLEERNLLRTLIDHVSDYLYVKDNQGRTILSNRMQDALWGAATAEVTRAKKADDHFSRRETGRLLADERTIFQTGQALLNREDRVIDQTTGRRRWVDTSKVPLRDSSGNVIGIIGIGRDITERKRIEDELAHYRDHLKQLVEQHTVEVNRANRRLEVIFNNTTDGIVLASPHRGIEQSNLMFKTMFVCEPDGYFHQPLLILVVPEDRERLASVIQAVIVDGAARHDEYKAVRTNSIRFEARISVSYIAAGATMGASLLCSVQDISELKQREHLLRYRASLQENVSDAVIATDLDFRIQSWNPAAERLYGWRAEEVLGRLVGEILPTEFASQAEGERVQRDFLEQGNWTNEVVQYDKEGRALHILSSTVRFKDEQGQPFGHVTVNHDITERIKAETELRRALEQQKMRVDLKTRFIAMASHDFRTPLTVILISRALLEMQLRQQFGVEHLEPLQKRLQRIDESVQQMKSLLDDVLTVSQADSDQVEIRPEVLDVEGFCNEILQEIQLTVSTRHVLKFSLLGENTRIISDRQLVRQILINLLSNAVKYSPVGGVVTLDVDCEPETVDFRVQDAGIGIPNEDQEHLFEMFHRAHNVGDIKGTGLGMAIVKRAVDALKGTIAFESQVGVGTTFTVHLPLGLGINSG